MELWSAEWVWIKGRFEHDWGVLVDEGGSIQAVGPRDQLVARAHTVNHYSDGILLPSFVNPHHHGFHRAFRGVGDLDISFSELAQRLIWPVSQTFDEELFDAIYRVAFAEQAQAGIGAIGEFHYLHNGKNRPGQSQFADRIVRIAQEFGLRLNLVYGFFDQGSSEHCRAFIQPFDDSLREYESLRERYADNPLVTVSPGIHSLEHTSPETIIEAAKLAKTYGVRLHVQIAERASDVQSSMDQYGVTPLKALEKVGVLDDRLLVINGSMFGNEELDMLQAHHVPMILCPSACLARGDNLPNIPGVLERGIPFAVGSDSLAMSHHYNPPQEIKYLELQERARTKSMNVLAKKMDIASLWDLGSQDAAHMLGWETAQMMPGCPADLIIAELKQHDGHPSPNVPAHYFLNQLIFGWGEQAYVTHLMVQGRMVVKNGVTENPVQESYRRLNRWNEAFLKSIKKTGKSDADPSLQDTVRVR